MSMKIDWDVVYQELSKGIRKKPPRYYATFTRDRKRNWLERQRTITMGSAGLTGQYQFALTSVLNNPDCVLIVSDVLSKRDVHDAVASTVALTEDFKAPLTPTDQEQFVKSIDTRRAEIHSRVFTALDLESLSVEAAEKLISTKKLFIIADASRNYKCSMIYNFIAAYCQDPGNVKIVRLENVHKWTD